MGRSGEQRKPLGSGPVLANRTHPESSLDLPVARFAGACVCHSEGQKLGGEALAAKPPRPSLWRWFGEAVWGRD